MAYTQVRELIPYIKQFYAELEELYDNLGEEEADPRLELLLQYMGRHERNIAQALAAYEDDAAEGVLNTWLQYTSALELKQTFHSAIDEINASDNLDAEEIVSIGLRVDERLKEFYRQGRDETSVPRVQEFFANLLQLEEGKDHDYAKSVLGIRDE